MIKYFQHINIQNPDLEISLESFSTYDQRQIRETWVRNTMVWNDRRPQRQLSPRAISHRELSHDRKSLPQLSVNGMTLISQTRITPSSIVSRENRKYFDTLKSYFSLSIVSCYALSKMSFLPPYSSTILSRGIDRLDWKDFGKVVVTMLDFAPRGTTTRKFGTLTAAPRVRILWPSL